MRHRRRGRTLGRSPTHQRALLRNLACSLFLTEREDVDEGEPKVKGRIVTTLAKAKEVRPLVERCITIARRSLDDQRRAEELASDAERLTDEWRAWRESERWNEWNAANAPVLAARRRVIKLLGASKRDTKEAIRILFDTVAPRFEDRPGGYTRIVRLAMPRLGDAGPRAILELVGVRDRVHEARSEAPSFDDEPPEDETPEVEEAKADEAETSEPPEADSAETEQEAEETTAK